MLNAVSVLKRKKKRMMTTNKNFSAISYQRWQYPSPSPPPKLWSRGQLYKNVLACGLLFWRGKLVRFIVQKLF
jgi:hypothetical protein